MVTAPPPDTAARVAARPHPLRMAPVLAIGLALGLGGVAACSADDGASTVPSLDTPATTLTLDQAAPDSEAADSEVAEGQIGATPEGAPADTEVPIPERLAGNYVPEVVATYPHDTTVFTQGLEFVDGALLESGGGWNASSLRLFDPATGVDHWRLDLAEDDLFAEGVTVVDGEALQLTWQSETLLVTELGQPATVAPTEPERQVGAYQGEGWGLCYDGVELAMTDGSDTLTFRRPDTFEVIRSVSVTIEGQPVEELNELACIGDQVLANVWLTTSIVAINPDTGAVEAVIDAATLIPESVDAGSGEVLNGIAYHPERGTYWLTGKRWPTLYEVVLLSG